MSGGRLISGFVRGIPDEYQVHNVALAQSRARFEEAFDIIRKAWTEEIFSYQGEFWSYRDVAMWPRPVQQPHPPIWMPVVGSKESIEFAARHDLPITPGLGRSRGLRDDIIRYYARCLAEAGHRITPDHLSLGISAYVADSKAATVREMGPITSISIAPYSATAISPRRNCSARPVIPAPHQPIMSARRTAARPSSRARISAA